MRGLLPAQLRQTWEDTTYLERVLGRETVGTAGELFAGARVDIDAGKIPSQLAGWLRTGELTPDGVKTVFGGFKTLGPMLSKLGVLKEGPAGMAQMASLFVTPEGTLRKGPFMAAANIAGFGQKLWKQLMVEKNPTAWLALLAIALPIVWLLAKLGGRALAAVF